MGTGRTTWLGYMNYIMEGFEVTEETIAADLIQEIGIGGNFLAEEHTVEHMAESRHTDRLFTRNFWSAEPAGNSCEDILQRAHRFVEEATAGYRNMEPVLEPHVVRELDRIYDAAVEELT